MHLSEKENNPLSETPLKKGKRKMDETDAATGTQGHIYCINEN